MASIGGKSSQSGFGGLVSYIYITMRWQEKIIKRLDLNSTQKGIYWVLSLYFNHGNIQNDKIDFSIN